jgi:hypothetical protein
MNLVKRFVQQVWLILLLPFLPWALLLAVLQSPNEKTQIILLQFASLAMLVIAILQMNDRWAFIKVPCASVLVVLICLPELFSQEGFHAGLSLLIFLLGIPWFIRYSRRARQKTRADGEQRLEEIRRKNLSGFLEGLKETSRREDNQCKR